MKLGIIGLPQSGKSTIFAGHWHNLLYERLNGHRYIVHSATGGRLSPKPVDEFGYFFHFLIPPCICLWINP